jgi:hypothetical protein
VDDKVAKIAQQAMDKMEKAEKVMRKRHMDLYPDRVSESPSHEELPSDRYQPLLS